MEWFRNPDSNREFEKYVQQLPPEADQKILRDYFIPIYSQYRVNISSDRDKTQVLEELLINDDTIQDLPERRRKKVKNIIRNAINICHSFGPLSSPAGTPEPKETSPSPNRNTDLNYNEDLEEDREEERKKRIATLSELKRQGNLFFENKNFTDAISCYSKAIELDPSEPIYFSNRALCYLKLLVFESALLDAEKAVSINTAEFKYQYRLALALSGLGNHVKSCEILEKLCLMNLDTASPVLQRERELLRNTEGEFDFAELEMKAGRKEEIQIGDFIGPLSIAQSSEGSYSLCVTRDVKKGEIILVSKAVAYSACTTEVNSNCNLNESASPNSASTEHTTNLKNKLRCKAKYSVLALHRIYHLFYRNSEEAPVSIELYCSNGFQEIRDKACPNYVLSDLEQVARNHFYSVTPSGSSHVKLGCKNTARGIWYLPSFINHSCLATGHQRFIGDISVACVDTDLCTGAEITLSYIPVYDCTCVEERRELLSEWGIECNCKLCDFESDSRNTELLQRAIRTRTNSLRLSSLTDNPLQIIGTPQYELLAELLSIAVEMQLGPKMFNAAFWHAVIALTKLRVAPNDSSTYFDFINKVEVFICELELTHQLLLWKNVLSYIEYIQLPEKDKRRVEVEQKYQEVKRKYH